jgi:hypothetical protein
LERLPDKYGESKLLQTLHLFDGAEPNEPPHAAMAEGHQDVFRYAFLALLAVNVFLIAGGVSFAFLYFSH